MGNSRKLEDVLRDLTPLKKQGPVEGFFNNVVNADKLGSLVEGIRDAMMEYQVCESNYSFLPRLTFAPDFITARNLQHAARSVRRTARHARYTARHVRHTARYVQHPARYL